MKSPRYAVYLTRAPHGSDELVEGGFFTVHSADDACREHDEISAELGIYNKHEVREQE